MDLLRLLKTGQESDSFSDNFEQHFKYTTSRTDLRKCMKLKVVNHINLVVAMKIFTKPKCNLCIEERLTILKYIIEKHVTMMNKNLDIYGACRK